MDVSNVSAQQRFGIGVACTVLAETVLVLGHASIGPDLGPVVRLGSLALLAGVGFLGAAVEPALTRRLGADDWSALSSGKQTAALFVMAVTAIVLYGVVSAVGNALVSALA